MWTEALRVEIREVASRLISFTGRVPPKCLFLRNDTIDQ